MKRILILWFVLNPLIIFAQNTKTISKQDLTGTWLINEVKLNNGLIIEKNEAYQDEIILRENDTQTSTDKAFNYEETGPWRLIDNKYIELTDSKKNQKKTFEIISLQDRILKLRMMTKETSVEMKLYKK